jgi:PKD repeat protein
VGESESKPGLLAGGLKTVIGTLAGLLSGALMMYLSPLLDKAIKPAKPVANFGIEAEGLTVSFHNRSAGGGEGWWDFGDGSPLEPFSPQQETITHTYPKPDSYAAKLTLRNLIDDENERTVTVALSNAQGVPPVIEGLEVISVSPGDYAPATFRVVSKAKNADLAIWDFGDDRPLEVNADTPNGQDRFVTFEKPGSHKIKLAAVSGKQAVVKSAIVNVLPPPAGTLTAFLNVTDQATRVEKRPTSVCIPLQFPAQSKADVEPFSREIPARAGFDIAEARLDAVKGGNARNVQVQVAADRRSVRLTGELVKQAGMLHRNAPPATVFLQVQLVQERQIQATRPPCVVTANLAMPGSVLLPLPPCGDWVVSQRQLHLELHEGSQAIWKQSQGPLPHGLTLDYHQRRWSLTATPVGNQLRVELTELKPRLGPSAN